jgi:hypothetical protein
MNAAASLITEHLASCLPPDVPPSYQSISNARLAGYGKGRRAIADLIMFDGKAAQIEVTERDGMRRHRWISLEGGAVFFENGRWQRESEPA